MSQGNRLIPKLPTRDYELNIFLAKVARKIRDDELNTLKFICSGNGGLCKRDRENITDALLLFSKLREQEVITTENLLTLQAMVWHLNRKDLYEDFVAFCEQMDKTLYFFEEPSQESVRNGNLWQFHVRGHTANCDLNYLNKLRDTVARILCCPPEKVSVRGVQETHSLIITLEIPEMCNVILYNLNRCKWEQLVFVDVDKYRKKGGEFIELGTRRPASDSKSNESKTEEKGAYCRSESLTDEMFEPSRFMRESSRRDAMIHVSGNDHPELTSVLERIERFQRRIESVNKSSEPKPKPPIRRRKHSVDANLHCQTPDIPPTSDRIITARCQVDSGFQEHSPDSSSNIN